MVKYVLKRDNVTKVEYDSNKIKIAIQKANQEVPEKFRISNESINKIIEILEVRFKNNDIIKVEDIQDYIEVALLSMKKFKLGKAYITYRYKRELVRKANTTDESIMSLINDQNKELAGENSNKKSVINSTKRDLIAGEVSKDIARRKLIPAYIVQAHDEGAIHYHK